MPSENGSQSLLGLEQWVASICCDARSAKCTTIGLVGGSRQGSDRRVTDALAKQLSNGLNAAAPDLHLLVVRLDVEQANLSVRFGNRDEQLPTISSSPLGRWSIVEIPMPFAPKESWTLDQLSRWLPEWKREFGVILIDLGAMHLAPSRSVGRLCDGCYVVLGPDSCASSDWILQHIAWHERAGTQVLGTLISTFERAA